jgi:TolB-like protein/Flp pilus assembly protein TadD
MSTSSRAIFVSYASEDAAAAQRIAQALGAAGIEVWLDKSELRGGDAWDRKIRKQIRECALFLPIVSVHSDARQEGYFRREWRLAVERSGDMAEDKTFVVPVAIDDTSERSARVPDAFKHVQWTRLPAGETTPAFVERVRGLLSPDSSPTGGATVFADQSGPTSRPAVHQSWRWRSNKGLLVTGVVIAVALLVIAVDRFSLSRRPRPPTLSAASATHSASTPAPATLAAFNPPRHSIAVLPFVSLSGDKEQEYFSDGLTEELLNSLADIEGLQVAARTSSFSFREHPDVATVAHKLNVGAVLEGSVRRSGHTIRVTAQLINAVTGFHLWSKTYDRDLGDVLQLQTEIATAVATVLKVTLLGDLAAKIELGGTRNPDAFDAYLRGLKASQTINDPRDIPRAVDAYTEALALDPNYALALARRSMALTLYSADEATGAAFRKSFEQAEADARRALAIAPELAQAHLALANVFRNKTLEFSQARAEYERAVALAPGDAQVLRQSGGFAAAMGHFDAGIAAARRAIVLDPLDQDSHFTLGMALYSARRYRDAARAFGEAISLNSDFTPAHVFRGLSAYAYGDFERARTACEAKRDYWFSQWCLAVVYEKLGWHADAQAELAKMKAAQGDRAAFHYAAVYAQWGDRPHALVWLDTAVRSRNSALEYLRTAPLLDPLRSDSRFQAIERELNFPD